MAAEQPRVFWSSRLVFLLAAVGSAVGLGNIWKFPYTAGANGGAVFVIIYVVIVALIIAPILMAELMIGRMGHKSPILTLQTLVGRIDAKRAWTVIGWLGVLIGFIVLSYFSVIAGWAAAFVGYTASGMFSGAAPGDTVRMFEGFLARPGRLVFWNGLFMGLTVFVVARGVNRGIEKVALWLMPPLFGILVLLVIYGAAVGNFAAAWDFLFAFDIGEVSATTILAALGQAFLSNSVAMGIMLVYGSYMRADMSLGRSAFMITGTDTLVALTAGLAIFPLVFAYGLQPTEGPGLIFMTLPVAFGQMPGGQIIGTLFFLLLSIAALTSTISLLEPLVSYLEERRGAKRPVMAVLGGIAAFVFGLAPIFSFNLWADVNPLGWLSGFQDKSVFDVIDFVTSSLLLPISGLLITLFAGWILSRETTRAELKAGAPLLFDAWRFVVRFAAPAALLAILGYNIAGALGG